MSVSKAGRPWRAATGIALISAVIAACGAPSQVEVVISSARRPRVGRPADGLQTQSATVGGTGRRPGAPLEPDPRVDDLAGSTPADQTHAT